MLDSVSAGIGLSPTNTTMNNLWNLVADIGGTNGRLGLEDYATSRLHLTKRYTVSQHKDFSDVLSHFLADIASVRCCLPYKADLFNEFNSLRAVF